MEQSSVTSAAFASVDAGSPVMAMSLRADAADRFEQPQQLLGLAAVRKRNDDIVVADGAEIAVRGFGRDGGTRLPCPCSTASPQSSGR